MPKIQRSSIPPELLQHLLRRAREREITLEMLHQVLHWVEENPTVPEGDWFKRFLGSSSADGMQCPDISHATANGGWD